MSSPALEFATEPYYHVLQRELFCAALYNGPLGPADAIVVLSGDGEARLEVAVNLLRPRMSADGLVSMANRVVVTGGVDDPPHSLTAEAMAGMLVGHGLAPDRLLIDGEAQNTYDSAVTVVTLALDNEWRNIILVTSAYHMPRTFLTFLGQLHEHGKTDDIRLMPAPGSLAAHIPWWGNPAGLETSRIDLLADEFRKIDEYGAKGHVASYQDGLAYLERWEAGR